MLTLLSISGILQWLNDHMLSCPSKKYLHIECPGCGFQRSILLLLKGHFAESVQMYPATIPMITLIVFTMFHLKYKFLHGANIIKYFQLAIAIVIVVFYIYKILNHKIIA